MMRVQLGNISVCMRASYHKILLAFKHDHRAISCQTMKRTTWQGSQVPWHPGHPQPQQSHTDPAYLPVLARSGHPDRLATRIPQAGCEHLGCTP